MRGGIGLAAVAAIALGITPNTQSIRPARTCANPYAPAELKAGRPGAKFARKAYECKIGKRG